MGAGTQRSKCCREVPERRIMVYRVTAPRERPGGPMPLVCLDRRSRLPFHCACLSELIGVDLDRRGCRGASRRSGRRSASDGRFLVLGGIFAFCGVVLGLAPLRRLLVSRAPSRLVPRPASGLPEKRSATSHTRCTGVDSLPARSRGMAAKLAAVPGEKGARHQQAAQRREAQYDAAEGEYPAEHEEGVRRKRLLRPDRREAPRHPRRSRSTPMSSDRQAQMKRQRLRRSRQRAAWAPGTFSGRCNAIYHDTPLRHLAAALAPLSPRPHVT